MPKTVLTHGCFDLLHLGHIRHLQEARKLGDRLVVSVTADKFIRKGMGRPFFSAQERIEALRALDCVDDAFVAEGPDAIPSIEVVRPAYYAKGHDYEDAKGDMALAMEVAKVEAVGGKFVVTKPHAGWQTQKYSSSRLINATRLSDDVIAYLQGARERGFIEKIKAAFVAADKLDMAYVGEQIIDEYQYVSGLNKPSKEFILATALDHVEQYRGGIEAAASHMEWSTVRIVTGGSAITKTRFVDVDFNKKLFEVYSTPRLQIKDAQRLEFRRSLSKAVRECDAVVVLDFGHGLIGEPEKEIIRHAGFLAVNAQTNAANHGFNLVTAYRKADLVCVDEPEARLATSMQDHSADAVANILSLRMKCNVVMTRGRNGCIGFEPRFSIPAITTSGIDTIGAGDAFIATASPLIAAGLEIEPAAFVGNVAGAIKTTIVGHRRHVTRDELMQNIKALLA